MRVSLCLLLTAACVLADDSRRSKLPYIADAVGNTLPPPSNVPATVGSPVNLLTPDRYEFYTFDESGELVKRLMTLEEIQAIVAAGEETEGLVTFANENQPTIAFNFSQPPYTKVHNVVTNVQNVLKAQMEAHKNKPHIQPTLDTPDVSESWSLILPSIFGNTGVDIVPDKTSASFTTPETEMIEIDSPIDDNLLSKEGTQVSIINQISSSSKPDEDFKEVSITEKITPTTVKFTTTTRTTTTQKPTTTTASSKPSTVTVPLSTTTSRTTFNTRKPTTNKFTTSPTRRPVSLTTTTSRPRIPSTPSKPRTTTTAKPTTTSYKSSTTTLKPTTSTKKYVRTTTKVTTAKPIFTTKKQVTTLKDDGNFTRIQIQTVANTISTTDRNTIKYEKISTFIPISTAAYVNERTTRKPVSTIKPTVAYTSTTKRFIPTTTKPATTTTRLQPSVTTYKPSKSTPSYVSSTPKVAVIDKLNATTITTQSVSPSTTVATTEFISIGNHNYLTENKHTASIGNNNHIKENEPDIPLFDVAQSISQIASDLGNYRPIPTTSDLVDTTRISDMKLENKENLESKENLEIEIPTDVAKENNLGNSNATDKNSENIINVSTVDSQEKNINTVIDSRDPDSDNDFGVTTTLQKLEFTTNLPLSTTIDPVLSESMDDLLSQVVNPAPQTIVEKQPSNEIPTTSEKVFETTTSEQVLQSETTSHATAKIEKNEKLPNITESLMEFKNETNSIPDFKFTPPLQMTESKPISLESEKNKVIDMTDDKTYINNQKYVQISISSNNNDSKVITPEVITPDADITSNIGNNKKNNLENTEKEISKDDMIPDKIIDYQDTTTKKPAINLALSHSEVNKNNTVPLKKSDVTSQSSANKIPSIESDQLSNVKDKDKNFESLPKIDEFKKKIQKVNIDEKELVNERNNSWKLISTVTPPKANDISIQKDKLKIDGQDYNINKDIVLDVTKENQGLEITTKDLSEDIAQFTELCNELAFRYWQTMIESIDKRRSFVLSPYSITSMLAMMFMGARGATSGEMNEILKLDDMVTFNPHFVLKNISDSLEMNPVPGVIVSAFVRELFSDRNKGKVLTFYKERAQHFYNGHVEEVNFKLISDIIRRRTNLLVKRHTWGKIVEYMKANTITMQPPLAAFSVNIFQTDCSDSSVEGRDGEMYFVVSPNVRQRRLVPVPAVVYKDGFLAGYDPVLDATAASLGNTVISTLFLMPGQQGNIVHSEDLEALEKRLLESNPTTSAWKRLLRTLLPRMGLELQIPRFSHKSIFNISSTLRQMGLKDLFDEKQADFGGLIGPSKDLYLSDMIQSTAFVTCGGGLIGEQHHIEEYPERLDGPQRRRTSRWVNSWDEPRDYQRAFHDPHDVGEAMHLPLHLRPRQARVPARNAQPARLKFDRPFLYFVRHNPTGMILYVGRYNPRLLP